jgi:hypothetical protein
MLTVTRAIRTAIFAAYSTQNAGAADERTANLGTSVTRHIYGPLEVVLSGEGQVVGWRRLVSGLACVPRLRSDWYMMFRDERYETAAEPLQHQERAACVLSLCFG